MWSLKTYLLEPCTVHILVRIGAVMSIKCVLLLEVYSSKHVLYPSAVQFMCNVLQLNLSRVTFRRLLS